MPPASDRRTFGRQVDTQKARYAGHHLDRLRDVVDRQRDHIHPRTAARLLEFCDEAVVGARPVAERARDPVRKRRSGLGPRRDQTPPSHDEVTAMNIVLQ
jgi:hypothetical protein